MIFDYYAQIAPNGVVVGKVQADSQSDAAEKVADNHLFCNAVIVTPSDNILGGNRINVEVFP